MIDPDVSAHYELGFEESRLFIDGRPRLEMVRTLEVLLGPPYHLMERSDRLLAWREAVHVTRPGGVVAAVGISRYASLLDGLKRAILDDPIFGRIVEQDLRDGQHRNPQVIERPEFFTTAFLHHPDDLYAEATEAGLTGVSLFAVEGPAWIVEDINGLDNQLVAARTVEQEPALMGATSHIMAMGTAPQ